LVRPELATINGIGAVPGFVIDAIQTGIGTVAIITSVLASRIAIRALELSGRVRELRPRFEEDDEP
jgi:hypothetical protein